MRVIAIWLLVDLVIVALRIAAVEARPVPRCVCGRPAQVGHRCMDCTAELALSATIRRADR